MPLYENGFDSYSPYQDQICVALDDNILVSNIADAAASVAPGNQLFRHYDLNLSEKETDALRDFSMNVLDWHGFTHQSTLSESVYVGKELKQFMHSISSSPTIDVVTNIIIKLVNAVKQSSLKTTGFSVNAFHHSAEYVSSPASPNCHSWHYDGGDDDDDEIVDNYEYFHKNIITLVGPNTKFYDAGPEFKNIISPSLDGRFDNCEEVLDYSKVNRASFGQGTIFEPVLTLHSFPNEIKEYRLVVLVTEGEDSETSSAPIYENNLR